MSAIMNRSLGDKPEILALNKIDALDAETRKAKAAELEAAAGLAPRLVSGVSGQGVTDLLRAAWREVQATRAAAQTPAESGDWVP